ncbi:tRNA threonylcarbamoyladenosine biosynthesis protein TsaB [Lentibacillus persicus]|uniref:tRNA threonylcarbamoyladenosine biosynthesis protein TsaB n=1 Tax=Lentibacillus persicus TaxID=640948 RepID=A0A1I2AWT1_9BACI|nr:tRNA (adenosine(37)-N6)-threonylcarbamoyltransferase complex dimerization subunit type 1 TsaB [Lentibacillus persicus]SFE47350.1 tRNA threonylcarbamoyladenosine biosynthesis protein TsaB [Lentibacillus persicus]
MNILAMDTSNQALGVAVLKDGQLIGEVITNLKKNHSVRLMPAITQLMDEVGMTPMDLDKIVVAKGPGSYTGVRIGLTTAKSMAWALNIPVVGVSSLQALAWQGRFYNSYICPFFDARRGLVYTGLYEIREGEPESIREEQNILMEDWLKEIAETNRHVLFLSPDIDIHKAMIKAYLGSRAIIDQGPFHLASPAHLAYAGKDKPGDSAHTLTPNYLRLAEAEANWLKKAAKNDG